MRVILDTNVLVSGRERTGRLAAGAAELLVTGDEDLLELRGRHAIETPVEFVKRL